MPVTEKLTANGLVIGLILDGGADTQPEKPEETVQLPEKEDQAEAKKAKTAKGKAKKQ